MDELESCIQLITNWNDEYGDESEVEQYLKDIYHKITNDEDTEYFKLEGGLAQSMLPFHISMFDPFVLVYLIKPRSGKKAKYYLLIFRRRSAPSGFKRYPRRKLKLKKGAKRKIGCYLPLYSETKHRVINLSP